jgi:hypothetical protein
MASFTNIYGDAPNVGSGGYLVGVNLDACLYVSSSYSEVIGKTCLNLHMPSGSIVRIDDEDCIKDTLEKIGMGGVEWELNLERLESRDD